jgi:hypothetical protein
MPCVSFSRYMTTKKACGFAIPSSISHLWTSRTQDAFANAGGEFILFRTSHPSARLSALLPPTIPLFWNKASEMRNCERRRVIFPSNHGRQQSRRIGLHVSYVALHISRSKTHSRTASARLFYPPGFQKYSVTGESNTLLAKSTMQKTSALGLAWFSGLRTQYQA